jgi:hypothetical protein
MKTSPVWIAPRISASELDGKKIEVDIATANKHREGDEAHGIGVIRIQPHRTTSGLVCLWVTFSPPIIGPDEIALEQIEANHIEAHPNPEKADYLCKAHYATD